MEGVSEPYGYFSGLIMNSAISAFHRLKMRCYFFSNDAERKPQKRPCLIGSGPDRQGQLLYAVT